MCLHYKTCQSQKDQPLRLCLESFCLAKTKGICIFFIKLAAWLPMTFSPIIHDLFDVLFPKFSLSICQ